MEDEDTILAVGEDEDGIFTVDFGREIRFLKLDVRAALWLVSQIVLHTMRQAPRVPIGVFDDEEEDQDHEGDEDGGGPDVPGNGYFH